MYEADRGSWVAGGSGIGGWLVAMNEEDVSSSGDVLDAFKHGLSGIAE